MNSKFFSVSVKDVVNGLVIAVIGAIAGIIDLNTFNLFAADWNEIGKIAISAAVIYLVKKFITAENGKVLGRIG